MTSHASVLLRETIDLLGVKASGRYVDGTLGYGGHAFAMAERLGEDGRLLALDVDPDALARAGDRLRSFGDRVIFRRANFRRLPTVLNEIGWTEIDGAVFDLGISSGQLDDPARGLSFQSEGPLDMRLDPSLPQTALDALRRTDEQEFQERLRDFGETRNARRLSRAILNDAAAGKIGTTLDLAALCERVAGRHGRIHPATRVFLALRATVNQELKVLEDMLRSAPDLLRIGGRLAVISFHSLEDKRVKERFRALALEGQSGKLFSLVTKKPVVPGEEETRSNPRSRSAKLRVLERRS